MKLTKKVKQDINDINIGLDFIKSKKKDLEKVKVMIENATKNGETINECCDKILDIYYSYTQNGLLSLEEIIDNVKIIKSIVGGNNGKNKENGN